MDLLYSQNFAENADGWIALNENSVQWSNSDSTPSFDGTNGYGELNMKMPAARGPFSRFRQTDEPVYIRMNENALNGIVLQLAFYLDTGDSNGLTNDQRVDYSVNLDTEEAPPGTTNKFVRDYMFNFGFYDDNTGPGAGKRRFVVSTSNNSPGNPKNPERGPIPIETTGWYIFQHKFYPCDNDKVCVQLSMYSSDCALVKRWPSAVVTISSDNNRDLLQTDSFNVRIGWIVINQLPSLKLKIDGQVYGKIES